MGAQNQLLITWLVPKKLLSLEIVCKTINLKQVKKITGNLW